MNKKKWVNSKIIFTITMVFVGFCFVSISLWADYPESWGNDYYFHISGVEVADLENSPTPDEVGGYGDYTNLTAHLTPGKTFPVSLETNGFGGWDLYWTIWIDYDKDEDFEDEREVVFRGFGSTNVKGSISVPYCTITGDTRMRVSLGTHYTDSFGDIGYGEVEDYTVHITYNIGYSDAFSLTSTSAYRRAQPFTMPENGTIESIAMYHEAGTGSERMILAVYDGEGYPQNKIAVTPATYVITIPGWQTIDLENPVVVQWGTPIWLAWVYESNPGIRYQVGSPGRAQPDGNQTWSGGMPDPFGCSSKANYIYSIYAKYTSGGGETTYKTVGNTTIYGPTYLGAEIQAMPFTMPENGTIKSVTMYHNGGGSGDMILAVYDGEGTPQDLLSRTADTAVCSTTGWQTIKLESTVYVLEGATIWLAWCYDSNPGIRRKGGSPGAYKNGTCSGYMPDPFGSGGQHTSYIYSIYATYTVD